ncbi:MAG: dockerin type I repeat-containing protein [Candidatus Altiarchaeota archaeon]
MKKKSLLLMLLLLLYKFKKIFSIGSILLSLIISSVYVSAYTTTIDRWRTTTTTLTTTTTTSTSTTFEQCYDSDYGRNYYDKGYVKDKFGRYSYDVCISNYSLREYYCSANGYAYHITYKCPLGCEDGKCKIYAITTTTLPMQKDCDTLYKESNGLVFLYDANDDRKIEEEELTNKKVLGFLSLGNLNDRELYALFEFQSRNCTYEKKFCADFILKNFNKFMNKYDLDKDNIIRGSEIGNLIKDWESGLLSNEEFAFILKSMSSGYSVGWPKPPCESYGDLNDDGLVDSCGYDEPILYYHTSVGPILTEEQKKRADLNADGKIDCKDLGLMSFYLSNQIQTFPVCNQSGKCGNGICEENEANCIDCTCGNGICDLNEQFEYGGGDFPASACPEDNCLNPNCMQSVDPKYFCILRQDCSSCVSAGCVWCSYFTNFGICRENCSVCLYGGGNKCISNLNECQSTVTTLTFSTFPTIITTITTTSTTVPPSYFDCLQKSDCISCSQSGCSFCNWLINFCFSDCTICNFFGATCISNTQNCPGVTTTTTTSPTFTKCEGDSCHVQCVTDAGAVYHIYDTDCGDYPGTCGVIVKGYSHNLWTSSDGECLFSQPFAKFREYYINLSSSGLDVLKYREYNCSQNSCVFCEEGCTAITKCKVCLDYKTTSTTTAPTAFTTTTTTFSACEQECKALGYLYGTCRGATITTTTTTTTITITANDTKTLTPTTSITTPPFPTTTTQSGYYTCKDSDGGIDHYTKGVVTVYNPDGTVYVSQGDFCSSDFVIEYYCKKDSGPYPGDLFCAEDNAFFCEYGCENGACNKNLKVLGRAIATTNCAQYKNCFDCTNDPDCEWCNSSKTCLDSCDEGVNCAIGSCFLYMYSCGDEDIYCDKYKNCYDCTNDSYCEWCASSKKCLGSCSEGTNCDIGACHLYTYSCDWTTVTTIPITTTSSTTQQTTTPTTITTIITTSTITTFTTTTITTTTYTGICLYNEQSIGQDGCFSGQECCCYNQVPTTSTTTTTSSTTTSTTIQVAGFTVKGVKCWRTDSSYICEMEYDNYAQENAKILFLFKVADTGEVVSNGISFAKNAESGVVGSQFFCKEKDTEYKVSWKVYFASDLNLENPIIWCKSNEQIIIIC